MTYLVVPPLSDCTGHDHPDGCCSGKGLLSAGRVDEMRSIVLDKPSVWFTLSIAHACGEIIHHTNGMAFHINPGEPASVA
jgi:hypothetical protein